ncbi:peptidase C45 acyl-coenzyme A:6-aminopenicillanic acid acyl-transferas-like protein [Polyplosphaeria fusca]|uniref:Peptidase C45 acyl-coenzyme A:6-aminopenicillanic acid acyl-transferas-like protein n=1 Tax=Polyplosphaeria fusca TaxID=682080 RepID=A0A9P4R3G3_9PLEO|nr:peptidase C45 acyl-coenzyme A:6-aminopenicillanic acid acyl-transferas-like protein [Polyplosphaeria fusca]
MLRVECEGTPYEIGYQHGRAAAAQVAGSIAFYADLFLRNCKQTWPQVLSHASEFEKQAQKQWPAYHEEMRGIADGSAHPLLSIVALNVRTEINFGLFTDGCTSLSWHTPQHAFLAQNWDWMPAQKPNLIITKITQANKPTLLQITEAGIIGKIGFNTSTVGTCLNALKLLPPRINPSHMPVHFGLRAALECTSAMEAVRKLEEAGMASAGHILVADKDVGIGLEFSTATMERCEADDRGRVVHANHLLREHEGVVDTLWLGDSVGRVRRMVERSGGLGEEVGWGEVEGLFEDEEGGPGGICRRVEGEGGSETLFNVVMDLRAGRGVVRVGRPTEVEERIELVL